VRVDPLGPADGPRVVAAGDLFDAPPTLEGASRFLTRPGHHLLFAALDGVDVGFVSGVETTHPDKGTEMFLYELAVDEAARRQGIGSALVNALGVVAVKCGCYGMWVATDHGNVAALATYRSAGADAPEPGVTLAWTFDVP
jgi:ribosomal protein S18 acetylase RimI-like enzyme